MSESMIGFWENWLDEEIDLPITKDGYILKYCLVSEYTNEGVKDWICCSSDKRLFSFIKYLLIPSIFISRAIIKKEKNVFLDVMSYNETIDILCELCGDEEDIIVKTYIQWFDKAEQLEKEKADFDKIAKFIKEINNSIHYSTGIYLDLAIYKNIKSVGKALIEEYENENMLDYLEELLGVDKEHIEEVFENINENKFMQKKILSFLNERFPY